MTEVLGYDRYLTYGEDVSANVNDLIAATYPDHVAGILVTHAHFPSRAGATRAAPIPTNARSSSALDAQHGTDGAYGHVQATRPDTLAAASQRLTRGAAGLARREARRVERHASRAIRRRSSGASRANGSSPRR